MGRVQRGLPPRGASTERRLHPHSLRRGLAYRPGRSQTWLPAQIHPRPARGRYLPSHAGRVHASAVPMVLRCHLARVDQADVAGGGCHQTPAALPPPLGVEHHHPPVAPPAPAPPAHPPTSPSPPP